MSETKEKEELFSVTVIDPLNPSGSDEAGMEWDGSTKIDLTSEKHDVLDTADMNVFCQTLGQIGEFCRETLAKNVPHLGTPFGELPQSVMDEIARNIAIGAYYGGGFSDNKSDAPDGMESGNKLPDAYVPDDWEFFEMVFKKKPQTVREFIKEMPYFNLRSYVADSETGKMEEDAAGSVKETVEVTKTEKMIEHEKESLHPIPLDTTYTAQDLLAYLEMYGSEEPGYKIDFMKDMALLTFVGVEFLKRLTIPDQYKDLLEPAILKSGEETWGEFEPSESLYYPFYIQHLKELMKFVNHGEIYVREHVPVEKVNPCFHKGDIEETSVIKHFRVRVPSFLWDHEPEDPDDPNSARLGGSYVYLEYGMMEYKEVRAALIAEVLIDLIGILVVKETDAIKIRKEVIRAITKIIQEYIDEHLLEEEHIERFRKKATQYANGFMRLLIK